MPTRRELANALRILSIDAIQRANSGHPGMPMGMADIAEVLWNDFLKHNPQNPRWIDRDRFLLSNGHGSMLQYSLLHLAGYGVSMEDIQQFRQLDSITPGHPEYGETPAIEATTGPLGQGITNAVGMALAERTLAAQFNREGHAIIDHATYVFMGDGCMMEGISHEACSLAGTLGLGKLIAFWDDNHISIDGHTEGWFTDDTPKRFEAYGWHVIRDIDGHDAESVRTAMLEARSVNDRPSLLCCKTVIGFGAPNLCNSHGVHGAPLGGDEIAATRKNLDWPHPPFEIPKEIYDAYDAREKGNAAETHWDQRFAAYQTAFPELAAELLRRVKGALPEGWSDTTNTFIAQCQRDGQAVATRKASQLCLEAYGPGLPELIGGSADLTPSNNTFWSGSTELTPNALDGNYLHYGVREFGMFAIMSGLALHGGFIPYGGTFLVFVDYGRSAVRMAAMMKQRVIFVLTHDSIGLGEDGPTHQPIEHVSMLRLTPNVSVWRPCDVTETAVAWSHAIEYQGPTCLCLTRQNLPAQERSEATLAQIKRGGYVLRNCEGTPEAILIATGSEVQLAVEAANLLGQQGRKIRVVSMPSTDVFDAQDDDYKQSVLPDAITARVAIEAGTKDLWYQYVGLHGRIIGMDTFGASAPAQALFEKFGFTVDHFIQVVNSLLED